MPTLIDKLCSLFKSNDNERKQRLKKILSVANDIANRNPEALPDFVRLLGRKLQSDYMCRAVSWLDEHKIPDLEPRVVWFDELAPLNDQGIRAIDLKKEAHIARTLNLATDIVLPWPWHPSRIASCISSIGPGRNAGEWKQDPSNHIVEYWLPFGIGWVYGGNHSIMTGIIQGQGTIETDNVYDISPLFPHVHFDGDAFLRTHDNAVIQKADELEFAAIFEVGKLMQERGISA